MGDRWGGVGPPDDAYSRVTRDLATVTAVFATHLDALPGRLTATYDCAVVGADPAQRAATESDDVLVVRPDDPAASPLVVGRLTYEAGTSATVSVGRAVITHVPTCFCDACDETGEDLVASLEEILDVVTGGFAEFYRGRSGGYAWSGGTQSWRSTDGPRVRSYERQWAPWPRRAPGTSP